MAKGYKRSLVGEEGVQAGLLSAALGVLGAAGKVREDAAFAALIKAARAQVAAAAKSIGLAGLKPLEIAMDREKVRALGRSLDMVQVDVENWFYIYALGFPPMSMDGKCVSWRESLKEYAMVVRRAQKRGKG